MTWLDLQKRRARESLRADARPHDSEASFMLVPLAEFNAGELRAIVCHLMRQAREPEPVGAN